MSRTKGFPQLRGPLIIWMGAAIGVLAGTADAQGDYRPAASGRIVRAFDFEEADYNPLPVPLGWIRGQHDPNVPRDRPGFPVWNGGELDYRAPAFSGSGSVRLPTEGGSTSLMLRTGELGVFPDADYMVTARVRTQGLAHAQGRMLARLLDREGNTIKTTEVSSGLVRAEGHWEQVSVMIEGMSADAAYMQIELQLLQPEHHPRTHAMGAFTVWEQDFTGAVYFDDVVVAQLPRLELTTGHPGNIVLSDELPAIEVLIRDLTGEQITASARVFDVHGIEVDRTIVSKGSRRVRTDWVPKLTRFGWYHAVIEVRVDDELVGIRTLNFFWAPPETPGMDRGIFGIQGDVTNPPVADAIAALTRGAMVNHAAVNVWDAQSKQEDFRRGGRIIDAIDGLVRLDIEVEIGFREVPIGLADAIAIDTTAVLDVFASPMDRWNDWGGQLLDRYGQSTEHWCFGADATEEPGSKLDAELARVRDEFSRFVPAPIVTVPWGMDRPLDPSVAGRGRGVRMLDNGSTHADSMKLIMEDWIGAAPASGPGSGTDDGPTLAFVLRPVGKTGAGLGTDSWSAAGALARKALSFWWASGTSGHTHDRFRLLLGDAWTVTPGKRAQVMPTPELHVWRTLSSRLAGRRAIEELDLLPGARVLLIGARPGHPETEGGLIVWLEDPRAGNAELAIPFAHGSLTRVDLFENETEIPREIVGELGTPVHRINIGRTPVLIEGVNIPLARFLGNLRVTPDMIEARSGIHDHELVITNPWAYPISGRVYIVEPGGYTDSEGRIDRSWEISPRVVPFSLASGEIGRVPIELSFSSGELTGVKPLVFDVELIADEQYPLMRVPRQIELGFDGLEITSTARAMGNGTAEVIIRVTNRMDSMQNVETVAVPVREARGRASINGLEPGATVARRFVFRKTKPGDTVMIGVTIRDLDVRVNSSVVIP